MIRALHVEPAAYDANAREILARVAEVDYLECADQQAFLSAVSRARYDAIIGRLGLAFNDAVFAAAPALRFIVTPTTGIDHVDVDAATKRGIQLISLRGETAFLETIRSTAEHTFALLLALIRRIPEVHAEVLAGDWKRGNPSRLGELSGATLGIIGSGRLGRMVAGYGLAFGMRVLAHDVDPTKVPSGATAATLDNVLAQADVLSLHLPLNAETHGYLSADRIARLRRGVLVVNTARGELVDERALLAALESGHVAGAALDVLDGDSRWDGRVPAPHPLVEYARTHPNVILSPHVGGFGRSSLARARQFIAQKFADAISAEERA